MFTKLGVVVNHHSERGHVGSDRKDDGVGRGKLTKGLAFDAKEPVVTASTRTPTSRRRLIEIGVVEQRPVESPKRSIRSQTIEERIRRSCQPVLVERHRTVDVIE